MICAEDIYEEIRFEPGEVKEAVRAGARHWLNNTNIHLAGKVLYLFFLNGFSSLITAYNYYRNPPNTRTYTQTSRRHTLIKVDSISPSSTSQTGLKPPSS